MRQLQDVLDEFGEETSGIIGRESSVRLIRQSELTPGNHILLP